MYLKCALSVCVSICVCVCMGMHAYVNVHTCACMCLCVCVDMMKAAVVSMILPLMHLELLFACGYVYMVRTTKQF